MSKSVSGLIFTTAVCILAIFQILTTNIKASYSFDAADLDLQIKRMNYYPPSMARAAYIWEKKIEVQILKKFVLNFITAIDFTNYFPKPIPYIFSPIFLTGLYLFFSQKNKWKSYYKSFLFTIFLMSCIGTHAKYGLLITYPFILLFIFIGAKNLLKILLR